MTKVICQENGCKSEAIKGRQLCYQHRRLQYQLSSGQVRPPDYKEINTKNYKDPMERVEDGFGYYGAITQTNDEEHIQCHSCGYFFKALGSHITNNHKMNIRDYKIKYGLRISDGLLSPKERVRAQVKYNKDNRKHPKDYKAMSKLAKVKREEKGYKPGGPTWKPITRNEKGLCREQTIAKIRAIADRDGFVTREGYGKEYGSVDPVLTWFGSFDSGVKAAGVKSWKDMKREEREAMPGRIIEQIKAFYELHERTPQNADFGSNDNLPSQKTINKYFGTLNNAREAAGVPLLIYAGFRDGWIEVQPTSKV